MRRRIPRRGAAVVGLDVSDGVRRGLRRASRYLGLVCDVTAEEAVAGALEAGVRRFGGLDMLVLNAGVFPPARRSTSSRGDEWRETMSVNVDANLGAAARGASAAPAGARRRPGRRERVEERACAGARPRRVLGVEGGAHAARARGGAGVGATTESASTSCIRTPSSTRAIWSDEVLARRAASYGLTVDEYRRSNVLGIEVYERGRRENDRRACAATVFARTTGAQVPVDGGNERVI